MLVDWDGLHEEGTAKSILLDQAVGLIGAVPTVRTRMFAINSTARTRK